MSPEELASLRKAARAHTESVAELATHISEIPSPTGGEHQRAAFIADQLRARGYVPEIDDVSNVYARRGNRGGPVVMMIAHIDTVFPASTDMTVRRDGDRLYGPSIGDNSVNVAAMICALDLLDDLKIDTALDIVAVADVGEEGLGNLRGARAAVDRYRADLGAVIVIDGRQGNVTNLGVGSKRWRVTVSGPGGHSFGAFGLPSAIHGLGRIIAAIADLEVPTDPKTTFNVGMIDGGTSVNTIAPSATALLDMRSVSAEALDHLAEQVRNIIDTRPGSGLETQVEVVGERPAGGRDTSDPLVQLAAEILRWIDYEPQFHAASTDANVPFSLGIPAVCIGVAHGDRMHSVHEYIEVPPIGDGLAQLVRLCVDAGHLISPK